MHLQTVTDSSLRFQVWPGPEQATTSPNVNNPSRRWRTGYHILCRLCQPHRPHGSRKIRTRVCRCWDRCIAILARTGVARSARPAVSNRPVATNTSTYRRRSNSSNSTAAIITACRVNPMSRRRSTPR